MFGLSIKAWIVDSGTEESDDFSLILSHSTNMTRFLPALLELLESEFSLDKVTTTFLEKLIPETLTRSPVRTAKPWTACKARKKINEKLGVSPDKDLSRDDTLSVTVEQIDTDFFQNILDNADPDDDLEDIFDESIEKLIEKPKVSPTYSCFVVDCELGDIKFASLASLKRHQKSAHQSLHCQSCNMTSNSESDFLAHNCSKRHKCTICQRLFATGNELLHHSYIHTGEKPHVCDFCGKEFRQRATLDRHKITHDSRREHECEVCHKKFKHKHYLTSHKLLHEGVKPHICSWCGTRFTQNSNLQKHVRQKHTEEKSFVCTICGKGFVQPYYLRRHLKSHKGAGQENRASFDFIVSSEHSGSDEQCGIRTVACSLCTVTCKGQAELDIHTARHHPVNTQ